MVEGDILLYLSGNQVPVKECGIFITPPTIKQIAAFGERKFLEGLQVIVNTKTMFEEARQQTPELKQFDDLQVLLALLEHQPELKESIDSVLGLLFPSFNVVYEQACIKFCDEEGNVKGMITPFTLPNIQKVLNELLNPKMLGGESGEYNPKGQVAKGIAEKLRRAHEKKAKAKGPSKAAENMSVFANYVSILSLGMNMDLNTLLGYTPFQLYDAFERYWLKVKSDMYQKIATTPLMDVSKMEEPEDWTKSLYDETKAPANVFTAEDLAAMK